MTSPLALERLEEEIHLLAEHFGRPGDTDFSRYRGRIVAFATEVLRVATLYPKQRDALEWFLTRKHTVVYGAHGTGKDFLLAIAALYAAYVEEQLVLIVSATERQLLGQVWREIAGHFAATALPGRLYTAALEIAGERRVLAMTSGATSNLTGWHHKNGVAVLISESQAEQVEDHAFDAAIANTIDDRSRVLVVGNPITPHGRFYEVCQKPHWARVQISVFDHPNVSGVGTPIAGGPSRDWPAEVAKEFGDASPYYVSRVLGQFPTEGAYDGLVTRADLDRAFERFTTGAFLLRANDSVRVLAADIARGGPDQTCLVVKRGPIIESIETMREPDLMRTAKLLHERALAYGRESVPLTHPTEDQVWRARCRITIDDNGVGGGVTDRLRELGAWVQPFNGAESALSHTTRPERYANRRTAAYFELRERLLRNTLAIVPDERLAEELLATTFTLTSAGKLILAPKDEIRGRLGRSPDRADAVSMAVEPIATSYTTTYHV